MKSAVQVPRKSVSAWLMAGLLAAAATFGLAQNAKADTSWSVTVAQPGVILSAGTAYPSYPVYPAYPVAYQQPVVIHPHPHPYPVTVMPAPHPHGHAYGHWKHHRHHRHHGHHGRFEQPDRHHGEYQNQRGHGGRHGH